MTSDGKENDTVFLDGNGLLRVDFFERGHASIPVKLYAHHHNRILHRCENCSLSISYHEQTQ